MSSITSPIAFSANTVIRSADVNTNFTNINTVVNGNIDNTNIVAGAAIAYSKLNLATSIVNADIAAAAAIAVSKLAALTASRAVASDGSGFLTSSATTATELGYLSGVTSAVQTQISAKLNNVLTTTGDMVYSSSGTTAARLALGSSGQVLKVSGGIPTWAAAPSGGVNYIAPNQDAEVDTTGWSTYSNTAQNTPVTGAGAGATITWTRTTTNPLRGVGSYLWTRDAANRQGEGVAYDFTLDNADLAQPIAISFDFKVVSGTFFAADGITAPSNDGTTTQNAGMSDIEVFIYDKTNLVLIPVTPQVLTSSSTIPISWKGRFQAASNSTSYRLILHTARSTAVAFTAQFDNFSVGPQAVNYGYAGNDWAAYTPTFTGFGTPPSISCYWRRDGQDILLDCKFTTGTNTTTEGRVSFPAGVTSADTSIIPSIQYAGAMATNLSSSVPIRYVLSEPSKTYVTFAKMSASSTDGLTKLNGDTWANGDIISFQARVPIAGWSSNVLMSNDADTRTIAARYTDTSGTSYTAATETTFVCATKDYDDTASYASNVFTVPVSGKYKVSCSVLSGAVTWAAGGTQTAALYKNAALHSYIATATTQAAATYRVPLVGSGEVSCVAGDTLTVKLTWVTTNSVITTAGYNWVAFERLSGPSAIAATEKVFCIYTNNGGTALTAGTTNVDWTTKVVDSHAAWNGTTFTAPRAGMYQMNFTTVATTSSTRTWGGYVSGSNKTTFVMTGSSATTSWSWAWYLNAGDTMSVRTSTSSTTLSNSASHTMTITSQG